MWARTASTSLPSGSRPASSCAASGSGPANSSASAMRKASPGAGAVATSTEILRTAALIDLSIVTSGFRRLGLGRQAAHPERREGAVLAQREPAFADELEARRERRGDDGRALLGGSDVADEIAVEHGPVLRLADEALERLAGIDERPDMPLRHDDAARHLLLALAGIGREQVVERRLPGDLLADRDRLPGAAGEHVAPELRPLLHALCRLADRLEAPQTQRQCRREVGGRGLVALRAVGQERARFEVGEPGRHDEILGGELEAHLARLFDEDEVLLGERQDR